MKLDYMKEFLVLAEECNFTAAAARLFLNQSALSRHLSSLEEDMGAVLMRRTTHSVSLTLAGELARDGFTKILAEYQQIINKMPTECNFAQGISIGSVTHSVNTIVSPFLERLPIYFPNTQFTLFAMDPEMLIQALLTGEVDICFMIKVFFPQHEQIRYHTMWKEPAVVIARADDPIATLPSVSIHTLNGRTFVYPTNFTSYADMLSGQLATYGVYPCQCVYYQQFQSLFHTIRTSHGISIVSKDVANTCPNTISTIPIEEALDLEYCWAYRIDNDNPLIPALIQRADVLYQEWHQLPPQ